MQKIPIPDPFRLNYPHFIGSPTQLRFAYILIILSALLTFIVSGLYYYIYDTETIGEIGFFTKEDDEWNCVSIGTYNGKYIFTNVTISDYNLSASTDMGFLRSVSPNIGTDPGYATVTIPTSTETSLTFAHYGMQYHDGYARYTFEYEITWGNAPTIDECIETMHEYSCSNFHDTTTIINDIYMYRMSWNIDIITSGDNNSALNMNDVYISKIDLYTSSPYPIFTEKSLGGYPYRQGLIRLGDNDFEQFIVTNKSIYNGDNLCDIIETDISNEELFWGITMSIDLWNNYNKIYIDNPDQCPWWEIYNGGLTEFPCNQNNNITELNINFECELISDDYCIVNASNQFAYTENETLPTNTRMKIANTVSDGQGQFLLLSPELGTKCIERWESVCLEKYNIDEYCQTVYSPPYSCTKTEPKSTWAILSLSFASSQLVFTILVMLTAFAFKSFATPVHDDDDGNKIIDDKEKEMKKKEMIEMQQTTPMSGGEFVWKK